MALEAFSERGFGYHHHGWNGPRHEGRYFMAKFLVVADDAYKGFVNADMICMFRIRKGPDGRIAPDGDVEVEFIDGGMPKLVGESGQHFISSAVEWMGSI